MKLVHPEYTFQIEFQEGIVHKLIIESPRVMSDFVVDFKKQVDGGKGKWVLSDAGEILKVCDRCELIIDFFDLEINQRKIINALYDELAVEINSTELLSDWRKLTSCMEGVLNRAIDNIGYDITYNELEMKNYFKAVELKVKEREGGYAEHLLDYLQLISKVRNINIFILVNISAFFTAQEIQYLYEQAFYKKYYLLILDRENYICNNKKEKTIIIDKEYCIINMDIG